MNILFVSCNGIDDAAFGGPKGSIRNYKALQKYGNVIPIHIFKESNFQSARSLVEGYYPPVSNAYLKRIKELIKKENIDLVFFDQSVYGRLVKEVKMLGCSTIVFCHNCESDFNKVRFSNSKNKIKEILYTRAINSNEKLAVQSADKIAVFLKRDADRIYDLYGVHASEIIPLGAEDKFNAKKNNIEDNTENYCLLLSPAYMANVQGARWFVTNVAKRLKCKTIIAGKGFDEYKDEFQSENVTVHGFVENIEPLYQNAKIVAIPQLIGGGMKVKTIEAMMFGKNIVGTPEAFAGFDIDLTGIGKVCEKPEEFANAINDFFINGTTFNKKSRMAYEKKYSLEASTLEFDHLMEDILK